MPAQSHAVLADKKIIISIALILTVLRNKKRLQYKGVNSAKQYVLSVAAREGEKSITLNILVVYNKFIKMFINKIGLRALLKH
jgi:NADH:ubiquinone oxidoreductase subunit K